MGRSSRFEKEELKKGVWTAREDQLLIDYVKKHGEGKWGKISRETGLRRCGKSLRLRWLNYLRPGIKRGNIAEDEEDLIIRLQKLLGNRWSLIAGRIPGRTDNEIKNYWNSTIRRKLQQEAHHDLNESKDNSLSPGNSTVAVAEEEPHSTENNGAVGGAGEMVKPTSLYCFTDHSVKEQDIHKRYHLESGSSTTTVCTTNITATLSPAVEAEAKKIDMELAGDDEVTWNDFIMDLNEGQLDIFEFLQTDFSKLCESETDFSKLCESESPMDNVDVVGGCSSNHELPNDWTGGSSPVAAADGCLEFLRA